MNEEKIVLPIGKPPLVTHSAALLATLPVLKQSKVIRMLVWFFSLPERKLQSHEAIRICNTSQIIIYRASFLSIFLSDSDGAVSSTIANYTVTAFMLKFKSLLSILFWWQRDKTCSRAWISWNTNIYFKFTNLLAWL